MVDIDQGRMLEVIRRALAKISGDSRWSAAILRARREFDVNPYMHWDGRALLVLGRSNEVYVAGRACQCRAYRRAQKPCWHRAAARLMRRYDEERLSSD